MSPVCREERRKTPRGAALGAVCPSTQGPDNKRRAGEQTSAHSSGGRWGGRRRAGARDAHGARSRHARWQPGVIKYHDFDRVPRVGVLCHKRYRNLLVDFHKDFPLLILVAANLLSMPSPLSIGVCVLLPLPNVHTSKTHSQVCPSEGAPGGSHVSRRRECARWTWADRV